MSYWITHRLPTEADADHDGEIIIPRRPGNPPNPLCDCFQHYSLVLPGQPWWSLKLSTPIQQSAPTTTTRKAIQITSCVDGNTGQGLLHALCNDGTIWCGARKGSDQWHQMPPIPQPNEQQEPQF